MRRRGFAIVWLVSTALAIAAQPLAPAQPHLGFRSVKILDAGGLRFKDLNKNGSLDVYEDWRRPIDDRVTNLRRPDAVVWACILTWAFSGIAVALLGASLTVLLADPSLVWAELERQIRVASSRQVLVPLVERRLGLHEPSDSEFTLLPLPRLREDQP